MHGVISVMKVYRNERNKIKKKENQVSQNQPPNPSQLLKENFH
jgi:hypothetical protein